LRFNTKGLSIVLKRFVDKLITGSVVLLAIAAYYLTESLLPCLFAFFVLFEERQFLTRSLMRLRDLNYLKIGAAFITFALLGFFVYTDSLTDDRALFAYGVGFLLAFGFNAKSSKKIDDRKTLFIKTILIFSLPALGGTLVKLSFDFAGQFFLKFYFDFEEVAKYAIGLRVLLGVKLFSGLLMMFYPMVYYREMEKKNGSGIAKMRWAIVGIMTFVCILGYIFADELYMLMGASQYLEYSYVLKILIVSEYFFLIGNILATFLAFSLKTYISLLVVLVGGLINIVIVMIFMKEGGINVAAYAVLISNFIMMIAYILVSYRKERAYLRSPGDLESFNK